MSPLEKLQMILDLYAPVIDDDGNRDPECGLITIEEAADLLDIPVKAHICASEK